MFGSNTAEIKAVITAKDEASKILGGFSSNVKKTARTIGLAVTAAATAVVGFGIASIKAYSESEDKLTQLNTVLKSTKGIAGVTSQAAIDLSKSLQQITKFSDEDVLSVENLLLTFTKINKRIFPDATETVLDMATALGEDTKSAAIQLGKALQDPLLGITALRRVGVNFSDAQKDVIKKLVETGHAAKAQDIILKELHTEFGGSAKAAGSTFAGQLAKLKNTFNDVQEAIGGALLKAINPYVKQIGDYIKNAGPKFQENITKLITSFIKFGAFVVRHIDVILGLIAAYKGLLIAMSITGAVRGLATAFGGVSTAMMGATGAAGALSLGWGALAVGAAAAIGFGVYKLIQHFKNSVIQAGEVVKANGKMAESYGFLGLFVSGVKIAHENLKKAQDDVKTAQDNLKKSNGELTKATEDVNTPQAVLWDLQKKNFVAATELATAKNNLKDADLHLRGATILLKDAQAALHGGLMANVKVVASFGPAAAGSLKVIATLSGALSNLLQKGKTLDQIQGQATNLKNTIQGNYNDVLRLQGAISGTQLQGTANPQKTATPHAAGGPVMSGASYLVGERGPELFRPNSGGSIIPNNQLSGGSGIINININAGAYMGSQQDARRYAQVIISAIGDIASSKNKSVNQLLGLA